MAALPTPADPTLEAADQALVAKRSDWRPSRAIPVSNLGHQCARALWYGFRWCTRERFNAESLKRFDDGHHGEALQAKRLRQVKGVELHTQGKDGKQYTVESLGAHLRGKLDGAILGLRQAKKTWHVWEHKQVNEKELAKVEKLKRDRGEKKALAAWNPKYHAQAVLYMDETGMSRHYLTASSPGGRRTVSCRSDADPKEAARLRDKAERIIKSNVPVERVSEKSEFYLCKWCEHRPVCHLGELPEVTCRSCAHSTSDQNGFQRWTCALLQKVLSPEDQMAACEHHVYLPSVVSAETANANAGGNWIEYRLPDGKRVVNGDRVNGGYSSHELRVMLGGQSRECVTCVQFDSGRCSWWGEEIPEKTLAEGCEQWAQMPI